MVDTLKDEAAEEKRSIPINVRGDKRIKNTVKAQAAQHDHQMGEFARKLIEIGLREVEKNPEILKEIEV